MATYTTVLERCPATGLTVAHVPGLPGAHAQGAGEEEALADLREVLLTLREEGEPGPCGEFLGVRTLELP